MSQNDMAVYFYIDTIFDKSRINILAYQNHKQQG